MGRYIYIEIYIAKEKRLKEAEKQKRRGYTWRRGRCRQALPPGTMESASRYDEDEEEEVLPFEGLDKASALQQCRVFNAVPLDIGSSIDAVTQMLYLIYTGVRLTEAEATDVFFMSTKLLQSSDVKLRRLHYVLMKELSPLVEQSFIASNSLMMDIKGSNDSSKSSAIRTLYAVMDSSMYNSMDRTIVECMTSRNPNVVASALITGIHMSAAVPEMPRKWSVQLTQVMKEATKPQYAGIALLHKMRNNDRLSVGRLAEEAAVGRIRSPLAVCLVVKMCTELMREDLAGSMNIYKFVVGLLHNNSDLIVFEAAKSICSLRCVTDKELTPVVMVLQLYLASHNPILRFSAVCLLNRISTTHPNVVSVINNEIESLILDPSRTIATLAITSLLKTGTMGTIERLMTQLSSGNYMNELGDELKLVIVDAMRVLNAKFPTKYETLLSFLFHALGEDGSSSLKERVVDAMMDIAKSNPSSNEMVLTHLAEYIDDCEFSHITKRVLMHLGEEVPHCSNPRGFVRFVYNHATLEKPEVRAVAITTLAKIAAGVPTLRRSIVALLRRSSSDSDDEVRDRAILYTKLLLCNDEAIIDTYINQVAAAASLHRHKMQESQRQAAPAGAVTEDFMEDMIQPVQNAVPGAPVLSPAILQGRDAMRHVKQLRKLGEPRNSTEPQLITDSDSEYVVSVLKHLYPSHVVLQFKVKNMMDNAAFQNVMLVTDTEELEAEPLYAIPIEHVSPGESKYAYVVLKYAPSEFPSGTVESIFRFTVAEVDGDAGGDEDEYPVESFDVDISDFIVPLPLTAEAMESKWTAEAANETSGTYALRSMKNLTMAAQQLAGFFDMYVEDGVPEKVTTTSHVLRMSGTIVDEERSVLLVQAKVFVASDNSVALQLSLRGGSAEVREYLASALLS